MRQSWAVTWWSTLVGAAALGSGLITGLFLAFSVAVMPALRQLPAAQGMAAMQAINRAILNPVFLVVFTGTAALCAAVAVSTAWTWDEAAAIARLAGGLTYVVTVFGVTAGYHVPRNEALGELDADSDDASRVWSTYLAEWVPWNHVRTAGGFAAFVLLLVALRVAAADG